MRIAVDAHGGDFAPREVVKGAVLAAKEVESQIILVGREAEIQKEMSSFEDLPQNLTIHHASQIIGMDESPVAALMKKKDASISVCTKLIKKGEADAMVSAGNTGAVVGAATLFLRSLKGVKRAGIAVPYITEKNVALLMDAGANINCRPVHLVQYAYMASLFVEEVWERKNPSIGLMNIGEEDKKGGETVQKAHQILRSSHLNFIGNVEGQDLAKGLCDIVICDGFVGNVVLKVSEGVAMSVLRLFQREVEKMGLSNDYQKVFQKLAQKFDFAEYGGAPLLGTNGICFICHGRSDHRAIYNAIKMISKYRAHHLNQKISNLLSQVEIPVL